jgi:hypothetical protein
VVLLEIAVLGLLARCDEIEQAHPQKYRKHVQAPSALCDIRLHADGSDRGSAQEGVTIHRSHVTVRHRFDLP